MSVRAKFVVDSITKFAGSYANIKLVARYDSSIPEDKRFAEATPNGAFEMTVTNPAVIEQMQPGKIFYLDFTEAPAGTSPYHQ
jgi:hypothetical protein